MEKVELGKTGLFVHPIGIGANKISEADPASGTEYGGKVIETSIEQGLNFIDTAFLYGNGESEEIIGKTLKENKLRNNVILATKGAQLILGDKIVLDNTPDFLRKTVDDSLRRLQTDVIDLFYIHFPDESTPKYEAVGALKELKDKGKIRSIGVSNFSFEQLKEANQDGYVDVIQEQYNLIDRSAERTLFSYCIENDISFIPYYPLASGLLSGKYDKASVVSEKNKKRPQFHDDVFFKHLEKVDKIREIAGKYNASVPHIVLAFYLTRSPIDAVIPGARNSEQVKDNMRTISIKLTAEDIQAIEEIYPL